MKILTALDQSEYADIVLEHGLDQAVRHPEAELHFVTAVPDDRDRETGSSWLDTRVRDGLDAFGCARRAVTLHVPTGRARAAIASLANELEPDLLVVGRFHAPSYSDDIQELVDCPTLIVGIDGALVEAQCPACMAVRRETQAERLFCAGHASDRIPDLVTRLPPAWRVTSRW